MQEVVSFDVNELPEDARRVVVEHLKSKASEGKIPVICYAAQIEQASFAEKVEMAKEFAHTLLHDSPNAEPSWLASRAFDLANAMLQHSEVEYQYTQSKVEEINRAHGH